jgi:hypothetical protein
MFFIVLLAFCSIQSTTEKLGRKMGAKPVLLNGNRGMAGEQGQPNQREFCGSLERAMGIEPTSEAWEAKNQTQKRRK